MRKLLLAITFLSAGFTFSASAGVSVSAFVGNYELIHARYGMCLPHMNVHTSSGLAGRESELWAGSYYFHHINGGTVVHEDSVARSETRSYTTGNSIVRERKERIKANGARSVVTTRLTLEGNKLHLRNQERGVASSLVVCTYRRD